MMLLAPPEKCVKGAMGVMVTVTDDVVIGPSPFSSHSSEKY